MSAVAQMRYDPALLTSLAHPHSCGGRRKKKSKIHAFSWPLTTSERLGSLLGESESSALKSLLQNVHDGAHRAPTHTLTESPINTVFIEFAYIIAERATFINQMNSVITSIEPSSTARSTYRRKLPATFSKAALSPSACVCVKLLVISIS